MRNSRPVSVRLCRRPVTLTGLVAVLAVLAGAAPALGAPAVFGESPSVKVRPNHPARADSGVSLTAARNEFASFQVVVHGAEAGVKNVRARLTGLVGPGSIDGAQVTLYREALLNVTQKSGMQGETGAWPDALIPDVDELEGQTRKAFPFDVPAKEARAVWVDVLVPEKAPPGLYRGVVEVTGDGLTAQVPVTLTVVDVTLPSTASLASAFLVFSGNVCLAHTGSADCNGSPTETAKLLSRYQRLALEHRITLPNIFVLPQGGDWKAFDAEYAPFMDGQAKTRLRGARMTSAQFTGARDASRLQAFTAHFKAKGWLPRAYDYTGDEPPYGISFDEAANRAKAVRSAAPELSTLLTTTYADLKAHGMDSLFDIIVPVVNHLDGTKAPHLGEQRATYEPHLHDGSNALWVYQSCMSHGCAYGTNAPENSESAGWPSYMVDRSAAKNRAMQWVAFIQRATGELYYETAMALPSAWTDQFRFNGNGDGTLFYPGTAATVGGETAIPVASVRLKQIRQGMQDYEWLKLVAEAGDPAFAHDVARTLVPASYKVGDDGAAFDRARLQLVARYLQLTGKDQEAGESSGESLPDLTGIIGTPVDPITGVPGLPMPKKAETGSGGGAGDVGASQACASTGAGMSWAAALGLAGWAMLLRRRRRREVVRVRVKR